MPAFTYLSSHEIEKWASIPDDKECNDLLQELRAKTGENWLIGRYTTRTRHPSLWKRLFCQPPAPHVEWTLYADCHGEWQVMNLVGPNGGSVFHGCTREMIMNYMLGYIGGLRK